MLHRDDAVVILPQDGIDAPAQMRKQHDPGAAETTSKDQERNQRQHDAVSEGERHGSTACSEAFPSYFPPPQFEMLTCL